MKSLENRLADLQRALEAQAAEPVAIAVDLVTAETREEAQALLALPAAPAPVAPAVRLAPVFIDAAEYLADRGLTPPHTNERTER
jgi:hypothetical protein